MKISLSVSGPSTNNNDDKDDKVAGVSRQENLNFVRRPSKQLRSIRNAGTKRLQKGMERRVENGGGWERVGREEGRNTNLVQISQFIKIYGDYFTPMNSQTIFHAKSGEYRHFGSLIPLIKPRTWYRVKKKKKVIRNVQIRCLPERLGKILILIRFLI